MTILFLIRIKGRSDFIKRNTRKRNNLFLLFRKGPFQNQERERLWKTKYAQKHRKGKKPESGSKITVKNTIECRNFIGENETLDVRTYRNLVLGNAIDHFSYFCAPLSFLMRFFSFATYYIHTYIQTYLHTCISYKMYIYIHTYCI